MIALAKFAVAAVIAAATATTPAGCDAPPTTRPAAPAVAPPAATPTSRSDIEVQTMCDENGNAYNIVPDTPDARATAIAMCANTDRNMEEVGW